MNIVADESVAAPIVDRLRADGHTVISIRETAKGEADPRVLAIAAAQLAPLLTEDKDFGELVFRMGAAHRGVILLRLAGLARSAKLEVVSRAIRDHGEEFINRFAVVSPAGIRIRPVTPGEPDDEPAD